MSAPPPPKRDVWEKAFSKTHQRDYYFNAVRGLSIFHDDALPKGWAFGRDPATQKKFYYNMATNERQDAPPGEAGAGVASPPVKKHRPAVDDAPASVPSAAPSPASSASILSQGIPSTAPASAPGAAVPPPKPLAPSIPLVHTLECGPTACPVKMAREDITKRFPDDRPMVLQARDPTGFREEHRFLLAQLISPKMDKIVDFGAGLGGSTLFLLERAPAAKVYAVDLWHQGYAVEQLRLAGAPPETVALYEGLPGYFETFCANVWDQHERILPYRHHSHDALRVFQFISMFPNLVYIDADLQYERAKALLEALLSSDFGAQIKSQHVIVAGGGWAASDGVKRAVQETVSAHGLDLHVERGQAWTFCKRYVRKSLNNTVSVEGLSDASRVGALKVSAKETPTAWASKVLALMKEGDKVDELRALVGNHGRKKAEDGSWADCSEECWIDSAGATDRRCRNPLLAAVSNGRVKCATALIDEFGARVNHQSVASSMYTALTQAVYDCNAPLVSLLLDRGADPDLRNKWKESARDLLKTPSNKPGRRAIEAMFKRRDDEANTAGSAPPTTSDVTAAAGAGGPATPPPVGDHGADGGPGLGGFEDDGFGDYGGFGDGSDAAYGAPDEDTASGFDDGGVEDGEVTEE